MYTCVRAISSPIKGDMLQLYGWIESIATVFLTTYRIGLFRAKLGYELKAYTNVLTTAVSTPSGRYGMHKQW